MRSNVRIITALLGIGAGILLYNPLPACFNPADQWAAGVVWTAGEPTDFARIESLGTSGINYIKEGTDQELKYTFRSHYDPQHTMVFLGYFTMTYQPQPASRMAVILDTTQDKGKYDFAAAVRTELDWLTGNRIVTMVQAERQEAEDSLRAADRGDAQYWTLQKRVLSYNMWFEYDTLQGVWSLTGVNGVKGCGLDVAFLLPPEELGSSSIGQELMGRSSSEGPVNSIQHLHDIQGRLAGSITGRGWIIKDIPAGIYILTSQGSGPVKIIKAW